MDMNRTDEEEQIIQAVIQEGIKMDQLSGEGLFNTSVVGRHKDITPEQKEKMAELVASGKSQTEVARMFGICQPTVSRILKTRNARFGIIAPIQQHQRKKPKLFARKAISSLGSQLYTWYTAQKGQGWDVDDTMLLERAKELFKLVDPKGKEPDQAWLNNWSRCFLASATSNGYSKASMAAAADNRDLMNSSVDSVIDSMTSRLYSAAPSPPVYRGIEHIKHSGLYLQSHFASAASSASSNAEFDDSTAGLTADVLNCTSPSALFMVTSVKDEPTGDEAETSSNEVPVEVDRTPAPGISAALEALSTVHRYLLDKGICNMTNFYALENQMLRAELRDKLLNATNGNNNNNNSDNITPPPQ